MNILTSIAVSVGFCLFLIGGWFLAWFTSQQILMYSTKELHQELSHAIKGVVEVNEKAPYSPTVQSLLDTDRKLGLYMWRLQNKGSSGHERGWNTIESGIQHGQIVLKTADELDNLAIPTDVIATDHFEEDPFNTEKFKYENTDLTQKVARFKDFDDEIISYIITETDFKPNKREYRYQLQAVKNGDQIVVNALKEGNNITSEKHRKPIFFLDSFHRFYRRNTQNMLAAGVVTLLGLIIMSLAM